MTNTVQSRDVVIDVIKAFAIFSVIVGHNIQYGFSDELLKSGAYFDNIVFKFIYSYHMPLFMLISGYLFGKTIDRGWKVNLKKKINALLIPLLVWGVLHLLKFVFWQIEIGDFSFKRAVWYYFDITTRQLWFLWAILWCSIIVLIVHDFFKDNIFIYIIGFVASFWIPDGYNLELYKFMYPYFIIGYFYNVRKLNRFILPRCNIINLLLLGIFFGLLLRYYSYDSYIYTSGHSVLNKMFVSQMSINIYRYLIGLVGSCFVILLSYLLVARKKIKTTIMSYVGRETFGIYVLEGVVVLPTIVKGIHRIDYVVVFLETIYVIVACLVMIKIIKKSSLLSKFLLGVIR